MPERLRLAGRTRAFGLALSLVLAGACGGAASTPAAGADDRPLTLRLGYYANLTHAPAVLGVRNGIFAKVLGTGVTLEPQIFNAGPDAVTAILSNSIDAAFAGPNPTVNAYAQSHGRAIRVIAGTTSGGALLVVRPGIATPAELKGKKIADPQLGGTQDVALRWYLQGKGLKTDTAGGGDVSILPQENAQTLTAYRQGQIDGAWLPEPWASRLVVEGGAKVLVDERDLWPGGKFVTSDLIVSTSFLGAHPKRVAALLEGLYEAEAFVTSSPAEAQSATNNALGELTGRKLADGVVAAAWPHMAFTLDPLADSLKEGADHAQKVGLLPAADLRGLYDVGPLNALLAEHGQPPVKGL